MHLERRKTTRLRWNLLDRGPRRAGILRGVRRKTGNVVQPSHESRNQGGEPGGCRTPYVRSAACRDRLEIPLGRRGRAVGRTAARLVLTGGDAPLDYVGTERRRARPQRVARETRPNPERERPSSSRGSRGLHSPRVRATPEHFHHGGSGSYPIAVGKVFAMRYGRPAWGGYGEAVMRIRSIESVIPLDCKQGP